MDNTIDSWYAGRKGNEYPLIFHFAGKEERTEEVLFEKRIEEWGTRKRIRAFIVRTAEGKLFEILAGDKVEIKQLHPV
jgi:hypothetical protein